MVGGAVTVGGDVGAGAPCVVAAGAGEGTGVDGVERGTAPDAAPGAAVPNGAGDGAGAPTPIAAGALPATAVPLGTAPAPGTAVDGTPVAGSTG